MNEGNRLSRRLCAATLWALCVMLWGCGSEDTVSGIAEDDGCKDVALAQALPDRSEIASKQLVWKRCSELQVNACYGEDRDCSRTANHCEISLHDSSVGVDRGVESSGGIVEHGQSLILGFSRFNVDALVSTHERLLEMPQMLALRGGPPTLPVIGETTTGDAYGIQVPAASASPQRGGLISVIADRYVLEIKCSEPIRDHDHAKIIYEPFLGALRLGELP